MSVRVRNSEAQIENRQSKIENEVSRQSDSNRRPADYKLFGYAVLMFLQMF
jgi:hypothetical protein